MWLQRFFHPGCAERFKAAYHRALLGLALGAGGYNAIAFLLRRTPHCGLNAIVYGLLVAIEAQHVAHHERD